MNNTVTKKQASISNQSQIQAAQTIQLHWRRHHASGASRWSEAVAANDEQTGLVPQERDIESQVKTDNSHSDDSVLDSPDPKGCATYLHPRKKLGDCTKRIDKIDEAIAQIKDKENRLPSIHARALFGGPAPDTTLEKLDEEVNTLLRRKQTLEMQAECAQKISNCYTSTREIAAFLGYSLCIVSAVAGVGAGYYWLGDEYVQYCEGLEENPADESYNCVTSAVLSLGVGTLMLGAALCGYRTRRN